LPGRRKRERERERERERQGEREREARLSQFYSKACFQCPKDVSLDSTTAWGSSL
jgi:hypothetical protein